eukprot:scaffold73576_cov56-Attheya_sp.AAC.8
MGGRSAFVSTRTWSTSRVVSVAEQKRAGLCVHPICRACGTTRRIGDLGESGNTYAKFQASSASTTILQKPSDKSIFLEKFMVSPAGTSNIKSKILRKTLPSSFTGFSSANRVVVSLTAAWMTRPSFRLDCWDFKWTGKDRSRMSRPRRFLWGTTARGDTFSLDGVLCLISSHITIRENPVST